MTRPDDRADRRRRILLCSTAVPWPHRPLLGLYHHMQARAMSRWNAEMQLFSPAPYLPGFLGKLSRRTRGHLERPAEYEIDGIRTWSPRVPFACPRSVRVHLAAIAPELVQRAFSWAVAPALDRVLEAWRPHAILAHGVFPWGRLVTRRGRRARLPVAFVEHSADDVLRLEPGSRLAECYARYARKAEAVFAVGPQLETHLRRRLGLGNAAFLRNGVTLASDEQLRRSRPAGYEGQAIVLAAATCYRRKGLRELVEAFDRIAGRHGRAHLVVITDAPRTLCTQVERCKSAGRITVLPPCSHQELLQWMSWADLFALPSWSEAFGLVFVEALGAGTPVVLTDDCGARDVLQVAQAADEPDQSHGWVVPPRDVDALAHVLDIALADPFRLVRMGSTGRAFVARSFSWEENACTVLEQLFPSFARAPDDEEEFVVEMA